MASASSLEHGFTGYHLAGRLIPAIRQKAIFTVHAWDSLLWMFDHGFNRLLKRPRFSIARSVNFYKLTFVI